MDKILIGYKEEYGLDIPSIVKEYEDLILAENKSENWREELKDMMYTKKVFDIIEKYDDYYDWAFEIVNVVIDEEIDKEIDKILNQKKEGKKLPKKIK